MLVINLSDIAPRHDVFFVIFFARDDKKHIIFLSTLQRMITKA